MIAKFFKFEKLGTDFRTELLAGLTTFAAMSYVLAVHPQILSKSGMDASALITVTAIASFVACFVMAIMTNYPIALAPGMGINAYFTFGIVLGSGVPWQGALSLVFWNGVLFLLLSLTGIRQKIVDGIPDSLKIGVTAGIGLFLALLGMKSAGIVISDPATLVKFGGIHNGNVVVCLIGVFLTGVLLHYKVKGAILISILACTVLGAFIPQNFSGDASMVTTFTKKIISMPASISPTFLRLDFAFPFENLMKYFPVIIALLFVDMFDTIGTLTGVSKSAGLVDKNGKLPKIGRALSSDSISTIFGSLLGTSTVTSYIESAAGTGAGGRSGFTTIVVGFCFLISMFFWPLIIIIPGAATAPALIIVGLMMLRGLKDLSFKDWSLSIPAFMTLFCIPLTFNITTGIALGFVLYIFLATFTGQAKKTSVVTYILGIAFLLKFIFVDF